MDTWSRLFLIICTVCTAEIQLRLLMLSSLSVIDLSLVSVLARITASAFYNASGFRFTVFGLHMLFKMALTWYVAVSLTSDSRSHRSLAFLAIE
jgi:hypothetical protein